MRIDRIGIFLTRRCNFRCLYCCIPTGDDPEDKLTFTELQDLLAQASALGARRVVVPGAGEPLLDENLFPLFAYARSRGMRCDLATNASLITPAIARKLYEQRVRVSVKLHAFDPEINDRLAGKSRVHEWGPYTVKGKRYTIPVGLKHLLEQGYARSCRTPRGRALLSIETVVTTLNMDEIPRVAEFCKRGGLGLFIERLLPAVAADFDRTLIPSAAARDELYKKIARWVGWESRLNTRLRCPFETNPFIDLNGNIRFCFGADKSVGNIRKQNLAELCAAQLRLKEELTRRSPFFRLTGGAFRECRTRRLLRDECNWQC